MKWYNSKNAYWAGNWRIVKTPCGRYKYGIKSPGGMLFDVRGIVTTLERAKSEAERLSALPDADTSDIPGPRSAGSQA